MKISWKKSFRVGELRRLALFDNVKFRGSCTNIHLLSLKVSHFYRTRFISVLFQLRWSETWNQYIYKKKVVMLTHKLVVKLLCWAVLERFYFWLCRRLTTYADIVHLIRENQSGFGGKYSTIDRMFVLYSLIELSLLKKKIFCAFIDFKSAFDKVFKVGLCRKLIRYHQLQGKCIRVVFDKYNGCRLRMIYNNDSSEYRR